MALFYMPKDNFLQELSVESLKEIAQKEGMTKVPKNYEKEDLVKYLEGVLTSAKIKLYKNEYFERVTERETKTVREKISERGLRESMAEVSISNFDRNSAITSLMRSPPDKIVVEAIANKIRENLPNGSGIHYYDKMSDKMLQTLYDVFIDKKEDKSGRYFEYKCGQHIAKNVSNVVNVDFDVRNRDTNNIEIDIIGYRADGTIRVFAECKDRNSVQYSDVTKWLKNAEILYDLGAKSAVFYSSAGYTQGTIDRVRTMKNVLEEEGLYIIEEGGMFRKEKAIKISLYELRNDKFYRVFPK